MESGTGEDLGSEIRRGSGELLHQHEECHSETEETEAEVPHVDQEEEGLAGWTSWSIDQARTDLFQGADYELYQRMRTEHRTEIDWIRACNVARTKRIRELEIAKKGLPPKKRSKLADEELDEVYEHWVARNLDSWKPVQSNYQPGGGRH